MSVEKCRASASRAWLAYLSAARFRARDREKSTAIDRTITRNAQTVGLDVDCLVKEQPCDRLVDDPDAGDQQEHGLEQRREVLELAVAVGVFAIGGPAGDPHRPERDGRRHQVEPGMGGLGKNAQAVGPEADAQLGRVSRIAANSDDVATRRFSRSACASDSCVGKVCICSLTGKQ